jgi:glycosyltransferase involved in cell wall biosynthesis
MDTNQPSSNIAGGKPRASLSVFFPCHNEEPNIRNLVTKTVSVLQGVADDYEIIIVDDGSTDNTAAIADEMANSTANVRVIHHPVNLGYGAALQSGFRAAAKELVFYTDGDNQFDISELPPLLDLIAEYDIVSCYRRKRTEGLVRRLNAFCWGTLVNMVFGMKIRDVDCAFKLYKLRIFDNIQIKSTGALIDAEILARALRKGYTVTQLPVSHYPRTAGKSSGAKLSVILRAFRELLLLRKDIVSN